MINGSTKFGGSWTRKKLDALEKYLDVYTTALKNQSFKILSHRCLCRLWPN